MGRVCAMGRVDRVVRGSGSDQGVVERAGAGSGRPDRRSSVSSAVGVVLAVAVSGILLVAFAPELWWVFTTYFWVAFPAIGRLSRGHEYSAGDERELLSALRRHGEITAGLAAAETSLSVAEADRKLGELAGDGHLEVRARGGAIFYALWEPEVPETHRLTSGENDP